MSFTQTVSRLADHTPATRNRVVDLLRAAAIGVVVLGHWLMAAVYVDADGALQRGDLLDQTAWLHPMTWVLQVMPVFFLVGGYANALSWRGARERGTTYGGWLRARLRRLTLPLMPLMVFWAVVAPLASALGAPPAWMRTAAAASLVPTWFLAAYVVVVSLAPATLLLWERWGWASVAGGLAAATVVDWVSVSQDLLLVGFLNYVLVWGTVHQLGYAWLDGRLGGTRRRLLLAAGGLAAVLALTTIGPYAVSMVGVEGHGINNAYPTRITLGFLGLFQAGLVTALEPALQRLAARRTVWRVTVAMNARIMTMYLWHLTALGFVVGASLALGGFGLGVEPGTDLWWRSRPLWIVVLATTTLALVVLLGRFEQPAADPRPAPAGVRPVLAMLTTCAALAVMADLGIVERDGTVHWYLPLVPLVASALFGVSRLTVHPHDSGGRVAQRLR